MSHGATGHRSRNSHHGKGPSPNRRRRRILNDTAAAPPVDEGMTTSKAFWKLFRKTMGFEPSAAGAKVEGDGGYARHQAMLSMFRRKYGIRLEEQAEEKMSGDRQDPSRESADARMMMADFDRRLAEADEEYEFTMEAEDTFDWSDEAKTLADLVASDLRLEDRRRPELTTRDFVLGYFKTLRMKDMNIVRLRPWLAEITYSLALALNLLLLAVRGALLSPPPCAHACCCCSFTRSMC